MKSALTMLFVALFFNLLMGCATPRSNKPVKDLDAYQDSQTFSSPSNYQSSQNAAGVAAQAISPVSGY